MSKRSKRDMSMVVATGQVDSLVFEVLRVPLSDPARFEWRVIDGDIVTQATSYWFNSIEEAIADVMQKLVPDAVPVEFEQPTEQDFEALNALLYCGGQNEPITSMEVAVAEHMMFQQVNARVDEVRERAQADFMRAIDIVTSTHGPFHQATVNLKKLAQLFDEQMIVISGITDRNIETLRSFILNFLKE